MRVTGAERMRKRRTVEIFPELYDEWERHFGREVEAYRL